MKALTGVALIDGISEQGINQATVVISDEGKIISAGESSQAQIPGETEVKDCTGKTVMPGLIDSHIHICFEPCADPFLVLVNERDGRTALKAAGYGRETLKAGVTTVRDMGGKNYVDLDLRDSFAQGNPMGPRIIPSGKIITMTGGHGWSAGEEVDGIDEAAVNIAMGTDAGTPFNEHGENSMELSLMVENGMETMDAIKAATANGAELLGISDQVGTITVGKEANLLVLDANPLEDINNVNKINTVYKSGVEISV